MFSGATAFADVPLRRDRRRAGRLVSGRPTMAAISHKMTGVTDELAKKETGEPVQKQQKGIVRDLDELIAALEKECRELQRQRASNNPQDANARLDDQERHRRHRRPRRPGPERERLGQALRPRARPDLQSMSEGFPPEYRTVLERYYRRLAEEKTVAIQRRGCRTQGSRSGVGKGHRVVDRQFAEWVRNGKPVPRPIHFIGSRVVTAMPSRWLILVDRPSG